MNTKAVDKKLHELGGMRVKDLGMADEATGLEEVVEPWVDSILDDITESCRRSSSSTSTEKEESPIAYKPANENLTNGTNEAEAKTSSKSVAPQADVSKTLTQKTVSAESNSSPPEKSAALNTTANAQSTTVTKSVTSGDATFTTKSPSPLCILYGSATGNAEHIAKDLAEKYNKLIQSSPDTCYFPSVICGEMDEYKKKKCPTYWDTEPEVAGTKHGLIIVTSTTGNGDAPENAGRFVRYLKRKTTAPLQPFKHCAFAVLGLGDTNYDQFCNTGKIINKKLGELGGKCAKEIAMADEATGLEETVEPWIDSILDDMTITCSGRSIVEEKSADRDESEPVTQVKVTQETVATNGSISRVKEDEKKMDVEDTSELLVENSTLNASLKGVALLRKLLSLPRSAPFPSVPLNCLPALGPSLSSCALIDQAYDDEYRSRGMSLSEMDNATITTSSTTAVHYTLNDPFESDILDAKYLTNTNVAGAKDASEVLSEGDYDNNEKIIQAMERYEEHFPLCPPNEEEISDSDSKCFERNGKRVIELRLSLPDDYTLEYQPGDSIGLIVPNSPHATEFVLGILYEKHGIDRTQKILCDEKHAITVTDAIKHRIDLCSPIKNKRILLSLSQFASDPEEKDALSLLSSKTPQGEELYNKFIDEQRRTVVDILREFPSCQNVTLEALVGTMPSITPRYYSVTSSPLSSGDHAPSLTVAFSVVDYLTPSLLPNTARSQRRIGGLATRYLETICSHFLSNSTLSVAQPTVKIFPKPTSEFLMPSDLSTPLVLIGPGTGIAPFMGFVSHRGALIKGTDTTKAASVACEGTWRGGYELEEDEIPTNEHDAKGLKLGADYRNRQNIGSVDVFFGCRYSDHDWLYREEMTRSKSTGLITNLYTAFSREGNKSQKYVQDIMKNNTDCTDRLVRLITDEGAVVYVCGDGNEMGRDVQDTIVELIAAKKYSATEEGKNRARSYLEQMKKTKKFLMDIWS